jgi:membrane protein CcdC involved in cytochrome C biogenesis
MAPPAAQHALVTLAILALIAWRLYARIRRTVGRQRLSPVRPWVTVVLFPLLVALLAFVARSHAPAAAALGGGAVVGVGLGLLGLRLTRFEVSPEGRYYTPSAHLGVALSTLLVCRIFYRFFVYGLPGSSLGAAPPPLTPLTLLLLGTLAGYYTTYAVGLLRWSWRSRAAPGVQAPPSPAISARNE